MESSNHKLKAALTRYLCQLSTQNIWWYGVDLPISDPHSLARLLDKEGPQLFPILEAIGWAHKWGNDEKKQEWRLKRSAIESFIHEQPGWMSFLELNVTRYKKRNTVFLRIGQFQRKCELKGISNPDEQIRLENNGTVKPPRLNRNALGLFENSFSTWSETYDLDDCSDDELEPIQEEPASTSKNNLEPARQQQPTTKNKLGMAMTNKEDVSSKKVSEVPQALLDSLEKILIKIMNPNLLSKNAESIWSQESTTDCIIESINEASTRIEEEKKKRVEEKKKIASQYATKGKLTFDHEGILLDDYPVLKKHNIDPTSQHDIEGVLRDLAKLQRKIKSVDIFLVGSHNNKQTQLVHIPRSSTHFNFQKNLNRGGYNWVEKILDAAVSLGDPAVPLPPIEGPDDETALDRKDAALWLIIHLVRKYPDQFLEAGNRCGYPVPREKMSASYAAAVCRTTPPIWQT
jgi:hypothetical protein